VTLSKVGNINHLSADLRFMLLVCKS